MSAIKARLDPLVHQRILRDRQSRITVLVEKVPTQEPEPEIPAVLSPRSGSLRSGSLSTKPKAPSISSPGVPFQSDI